ncbi:MAG: PAS domain-containing protein [Bacteroidales bacterium]|nr:PAS domain-containing protein [Bacteroidales bacterium]
MDKSLPNPEQMVLNTIINNIPAMVFYKSLDGVYIAANEMFCNQLRTTPQEITGKTDFDFYLPERARKYKESDQIVIQTGKSQELFEEEITVEGQLKIYTTRKVLVTDNNDIPYGIIGLSYDVTESRKTEQELVDSRTRYKYMYNMLRLMTDNIPDLLWAKDLRKRYLFANKAICEKLLNARDTDEPIGKTDLFFADRERKFHPEDTEWHTFGEICRDSDELTMQQKAPGCFNEYGHVRGQFLYLDVQKAPILDEDGNMIGTVGSGRDITKQKLMEQEFQALYQRNRAIIEALPDLMFLFDDQGKFLECYVSNTKDLIAPPALIIGRRVDDFFEPAIAIRTREMINRCLQSKTIQNFEYELMLDITKLYYEARLIHVEENKVLCIARNITERKTLQHELILAKERAEESSRLKSTLLNNMSHELRTPLNGILGFSEIMANELVEKDFIEMANHINISGKRLMKTLDSVMQLSQLESGIKAVHPVEINPYQCFKDLINNFSEQARAKGLFLELKEMDITPGYIDTYFFIQAISNILENAVKFTNNGGVTIVVQETFRKDSRWMNIHIKDTGIGISEDHLKLIFEEFRQASEGQNRSFEGTGLGLTIAKKMIKVLGGDIIVESKIGQGSSFEINIPFPEKPDHPILSPNTELAKDSGDFTPLKKRKKKPLILLVEDNEVNCQLTIAFLGNRFEIDWVQDGPSCIEKLAQKAYAAVLMDINLGPGMDGLEATQQIRKMKGYEKIPIIALTGYTMFGDKERLLAGGCNAYLPKPYTRSEILMVLNQILYSSEEQ